MTELTTHREIHLKPSFTSETFSDVYKKERTPNNQNFLTAKRFNK